MLEDDPEFQGLLEEEAPFPEMSAELLGVPLKEDEEDFQVVTKEPSPDFKTLAVAALRMKELIREIVCAPCKMPLRELVGACPDLPQPMHHD